MNKPDKETPLDYFLRMLMEEKIKFSDLLSIYVRYLEHNKKENRSQIVESAFLLSMYKNPKLNQGTKKQLEDRTTKAIENADVFPKI